MAVNGEMSDDEALEDDDDEEEEILRTPPSTRSQSAFYLDTTITMHM